MIIIQRPRNTGKTTILLHYMVVDPLAVYVTRTEELAKHAFQLSETLELKLDKSRFAGSADARILKWHEHGYKILIDNADCVASPRRWELIPYAYMITVSGD